MNTTYRRATAATATPTPSTDLDLSRFDRRVKPEARSRAQAVEIPDGRYDVRIEDVELYKSPSSGNPVLKYALRILGPTHTDRMMWKRRGITQKTIEYVMDELTTCGLNLEKFSDVKHHLHDLIGVELEVTRKTRGEDTNIFFNGLAGAGNSKQTIEDEDLPF